MPVHRSAFLAMLAAALCAGGAVAEEAPAPTPTAEPPAQTLQPIETLEPQQPRVPTSTQENVWSRGVPEPERHAADLLFQEGNKLLRESITISAAARYRDALKHWDHPNIHFNLAIALMALDQPVETYEHLQQATKYGMKPLEQERYQHAKNYLGLLESQLVRVQIRCAVPGGVAELDGRELYPTPGQYEGLVRAGRHTVVARKEGYVTNQSVRLLEGGQNVTIDLELKTLEELTEHRRRWAAWKPWAVIGAGLAIAAGGGALHYGGREKIHQADRKATALCAGPAGCSSEPDPVASLRREGARMQRAAVGAYVAGGATAVVGGVLAFLNRDHARARSYDAGESAEPLRQARIELSPFVTPETPGLSVAVRF